MKFKRKTAPRNGNSRKQRRKEERIKKKVRKNEYFSKRGTLSSSAPGQFVRDPNSKKNERDSKANPIKSKSPRLLPPQTNNDLKNSQLFISLEQHRNKEKKEQKKLQKEMDEQRNKQLTFANEIEDRNIKKLEKHLKLNKRKSKGIPKSFTEDGLDYLLEVCEADKMKSAVTAEQQFADFNEDFEEDLALMSGNKFKDDLEAEELDEEELDLMSGGSLNDEDSDEDIQSKESKDELLSDSEMSEFEDEEENTPKKEKKEEITSVNGIKRKNGKNCSLYDENSGVAETVAKKKKTDTDDIEAEVSDNFSEEDSQIQSQIKGATKLNPDGTWEDIYGRLRDKDGTLVTNKFQKYIPPAARAKMEQENSTDKKMLERLKRQVKGSINRLAESNMHRIAAQIEELYMSNSRNDMNKTVTTLILESIVSNVLTPERLLMEHILLIAVLHANVGTEIGAHFLQTIVTKFDENLQNGLSVEDKTLDNLVMTLAQLYNFKLFDAKLMFEILNKLAEKFCEKNIDCILHILRNVGFNLRKEDPLALKDLILNLQKKASTISENAVGGTRVKFLLDILLAIKNNNMSKIPNYDNSYSQHLKKIMKGFIRKGNYVSQLNITLEDLLKVEEKGKWWVVGSAWTGNTSLNQEKPNEKITETFSQKLLKLAKKQRMNTDTRRNVFCIIMSAEDYLDAFEKLLHLGLTNNQDREIMHVILHCCLQEKEYNPYYAHLAQKFCDYDRKYQLTIKYSIWDKLKALGEQSTIELSNLAKLLTHLFLEKGLPISTLKIVQFAELDKLTLRFIRQILLGILLHEDIETCTQVFQNVARSDALKMFRESLRLFIHQFLLKNMKSETIDEKQKVLLETRAKIIEKLLIVRDRSRF